MAEWSARRLSEAALVVSFPLAADRPQRFLFCADQHFDSPHCQRKLLRRHLREAAECGAGVFFVGDFFDAMQGRDDRRGTKGQLRSELAADAYFSRLREEAVAFLGPVKDHLIGWGYGNHETAILKRQEVDLVADTVQVMNLQGAHIHRMGYRGWIFFQIRRPGGGYERTYRLAFVHGAGGGGEVTKGVIRAQRRAVYLPDADAVIAAHIHESWCVDIPQIRIGHRGVPRNVTQTHIQLPTYKEEYTGDGMGFHHEGDRPPKPLGGVWLEFAACDGRAHMEARRAT